MCPEIVSSPNHTNFDVLEEFYVYGVKHGNFLTPVEIYRNHFKNENIILESHWHKAIEILLVREGTGEFYCNNKKITLKENQAVLIGTKQLHSGISPDCSDVLYNAIVFREEFLGSATFDLCQKEYIEPIFKDTSIYPIIIQGDQDWHAPVIDLLKDIVDNHTEVNKSNVLYVKGLLFMIYSILAKEKALQENNVDNFQDEQLEGFKNVFTYISNNFASQITVDELCEIAALSKSHFCRKFKAITHRTVVEYINRIRTNNAAQQLLNSDQSVLEIAMNCGFNNFSYFIRTFKGNMGMTPLEFRRKHSY